MFGGIEKFQNDPHWHDLLLFHEYFHGDNGAGLGASHQTGWTGTVALIRSLRVGADRSDAPARRPTIYEINTAVWLGGAVAGRRARRGVGRDRGAAGRRRLADGRLAAQPAGLAIAARRPGPEGRHPRRAARPAHRAT